MEDEELSHVGRPCNRAQTTAAVKSALASGFININLDLMYGLPGQTMESWRRTLLNCCELSPTHLSCYALTVEPGTRLAHDILSDPERKPDESLQIEMDAGAEDILCQAGYEPYEISNYASPGFECRHNLLYWTQGDYLGLGPSAQSFVRGVRFGNAPNLKWYQAALTESRFPVQETVTLTAEEQLRDAVVFGLRLRRGIPTSTLNGHAANYGYLGRLRELREAHLIEELDEWSRLSARGRLYADTIAEKLY
jgi:oxygen-independent coproporphyrinogen-3 oxidase